MEEHTDIFSPKRQLELALREVEAQCGNTIFNPTEEAEAKKKVKEEWERRFKEGPPISTDTGPFALIPRWIFDTGVGATSIGVYGALACFADNRDRTAWPGLRAIGRMLGVSHQTVLRSIKKLEGVGAVEVKARFKDNGGRDSSFYHLPRRKPR